jgi:hypothetical protein
MRFPTNPAQIKASTMVCTSGSAGNGGILSILRGSPNLAEHKALTKWFI